MCLSLFAMGGGESSATSESGEDVVELTYWVTSTSLTDFELSLQQKFMEEHPKVNIKIETFSWNDFYTKWTTGLASGNVPDMSTALVGHVVEMINSDALIPLNILSCADQEQRCGVVKIIPLPVKFPADFQIHGKRSHSRASKRSYIPARTHTGTDRKLPLDALTLLHHLPLDAVMGVILRKL